MGNVWKIAPLAPTPANKVHLACGKLFYKDEFQVSTGHFFDISVFFKFFEELWNDLLALSAKHGLKINPDKITEFMSESIRKFFAYFIALGDDSILDCVDNDYFIAIKKQCRFEVYAGELGVGHKLPIHIIDLDKDRKELIKWFKKRDGYEYDHGDFRGLDFSNEDFTDIDFYYVDLRNAILRNVNFEGACLTGARFGWANLENVKFGAAHIDGTDFSGANLQNTDFSFSIAHEGLKQYKKRGAKWGVLGDLK